MFAPIMIFVAGYKSVGLPPSRMGLLTDVAPYWVLYDNATSPDDGVDPANNIDEGEPDNNR